MAQGDLVVFDQFLHDLGEKIHNLETDTYKCMLVEDAGDDPTAAESDPRYGAAGGTDYSLAANECDSGGNYTTAGETISDMTWVLASGTVTWDTTTNPSWAQHASNPTSARWAVVYNDTAAGKQCVCYVDLGSSLDLTTGTLTITWSASGLFQLS